MGGVHAALLARDDRVTLAAVHDADSRRARLLADSHGALALPGADDVIAKSDAVYITTPNTKHTELAIAAVNAGKHVFCEKPMATSAADALALLQAATHSEAIFQVGHNRRFAPVYQMLKGMLVEGERPHSAHIKMNRGELMKPEWVADPAITGGFLYETTIHMFDLMRFLFGEVRRMDAIGTFHEYPEVDDFSVLVEFEDGMHATLASSADAGWSLPFERIEVFRHHQTIATRGMECLSYSEDLGSRTVRHSVDELAKEQQWGYQQEDKAFVDSIVDRRPVAVTALDGYKSVELVDACYRAVRTNERIRFGDKSQSTVAAAFLHKPTGGIEKGSAE